ncbi:endonuclease/exonuclease/phosphatase [Pyxidicoccus fallax]|uniref:Endonuclease/exonuclease/phosphatase n=1 Tax=Pyxidicoccus fallax TaxID=394095 RepID=A0A848LG52_9BACT|nr:lamin tail domain-containing protein [Pyxidicoccus fallax]NMO14758.1 endonuclease/exonuclease/phosphatase [Pyxidicoccus fallax]NPC82349.1 endonuclease/exonuclease/phosphatase [Pyxidicoccus fallax]
MSRLRSLLLLLSLATACGEPSAVVPEPPLGEREDAVTIPSRGFATTLDVGTWNLEYFGSTSQGPDNETLQLQNARDVIQGADLDLWGVQEIVSAAQFNTLVSQLPGYAGLLGSDSIVQGGSTYYTPGEQKVGLLYKPGVASILGARVILTADATLFGGRPPLEVRMRVSLNGHTEDLVVIVLHAKAMSDVDSWQRRVDASRVLKSFLDSTWPSAKVLVVGDFNDDVDVSITSGRASPYDNFVADANDYTFPTTVLSNANLTSVIGYKAVIDHHLATNETQALYVPGSAEVYRVDAYISDYDTTTTDHLPVLTRYSWGNAGASLTVTSPNGGESWAGGSSRVLTWTANQVATVALDYSLDGGGTWALIGHAEGAAGSYTWTVPDIATSQARVRVRDVANASINDSGDGVFTITSVNTPGNVVLHEILANEIGSDAGTEFVELLNTGGSAVDLSGWTLWDATGSRHTFASGTILGAGRALAVFGKAASIPNGVGNAVGATTGGLSLNNGGDTVTLQKPGGAVVDTYTYAAGLAGQDGVSMNRNPDGSATGSFVLHTSLSTRSASPGTRANGTAF